MSFEILNLLGLAKRAGRLAQGDDMSAEAVNDHKCRLLVVASDAAPGTLRRCKNIAGDRVPVAVLKNTKSELRAALGRDSCAVCALTDMGFAAKLAPLIVAESPEFSAAAEEIARKSAKMLRRKKEKPRKK